MAASIIKPSIARYRGDDLIQDTQPESVAASWKSSAIVYLSATGLFTEADGTTPANITKIYGIAPLAAVGDGSNARVEPLMADAEMQISVWHSSNVALAVTAQAMVGTRYALRKKAAATAPATTEDTWVLDKANTTDDCVQVTGICPDFVVGTQYGTVFCKVISALRQYDAGA